MLVHIALPAFIGPCRSVKVDQWGEQRIRRRSVGNKLIRRRVCRLADLEYWGLQSIATRLGLNRGTTALEWYRKHCLPMMLRCRGSHPRKVWYAREAWQQKWEFVMSQQQREETQPFDRESRSGMVA